VTPSEVVESIANGGLCPKHPRYQKKRAPRSLCQNCWFLWFMRGLAQRNQIRLRRKR
jgi:hypothetical protein